MPTITATADIPNSRVRLDVDFSDVGCPYAVISRVNEVTGVTTALRLPYPTATVNGQTVLDMTAGWKGTLWDTEMPLDVPVHYTATFSGTIQFLTNTTLAPSSLSAALPWANAATGTVVTAAGNMPNNSIYATLSSYGALKWVGDGATANPGVQSEPIPVVTGVTYTAAGQGQISATTGTAARVLRLQWLDASLVQCSTTDVSTTLTANLYATLSPNTVAAPACARFVRYQWLATAATPPATVNNYLYLPSLSSTFAVSATSATVTVFSVGACWLKDPLRPANNRRIDFAWDVNTGCIPPEGIFWGNPSFTQVGRGALSGRFQVNNSPRPKVVAKFRASPASTLYLVSRTFQDRDSIVALVSPGTPLLWQVPDEYAMPDRYMDIGDVAELLLWPDQRMAPRGHTLPWQEVDAPVGFPQGVLGVRWQDTCALYATWGAATSAGDTWLNLSRGV